MLRVGTHLVDAMLWLAGGGPAAWVLGQAYGHATFGEDHPGPEHITGVVHLASGVRGVLEVGSLAPRHLPEADFWGDVAVTLVGSHGHARVVLGGGWEAVTADGGRVAGGPISPRRKRSTWRGSPTGSTMRRRFTRRASPPPTTGWRC
jgi:predicted dehydrogenase